MKEKKYGVLSCMRNDQTFVSLVVGWVIQFGNVRSRGIQNSEFHGYGAWMKATMVKKE